MNESLEVITEEGYFVFTHSTPEGRINSLLASARHSKSRLAKKIFIERASELMTTRIVKKYC